MLQPRCELGMGLGCGPALHRPLASTALGPSESPQTAPDEATPARGYGGPHPVLVLLEAALARAWTRCQGWEEESGGEGLDIKAGALRCLRLGAMGFGAMSHLERA